MMPVVVCRCCSPNCDAMVKIMPFATVGGFVDLPEGMCRDCLRLVPAELRAALRSARFDLRFTSAGVDQAVVACLGAWRVMKGAVVLARGQKAA